MSGENTPADGQRACRQALHERARQQGWTVIRMNNDRKKHFAFD